MKKIEIYKNDNYVLNDAFDQSVMNLHILKKQNRYSSFVICGCETGDGSTTVAINLAAALASSGWKTILVDGDMRKKNRYKRLNENMTEGLSDFLMNKVELKNAICETTTENLYYLPCGGRIDNPVRLLCSSKMNVANEELTQMFDYVIYDMPAVNAAMDAEVVAVTADAAILVSAIGETSKKGLVKAANALVAVNVNLIGTIINKIDMEQYIACHEDYDYFQKEKYIKKSSSGTGKNKRKKAKREKK